MRKKLEKIYMDTHFILLVIFRRVLCLLDWKSVYVKFCQYGTVHTCAEWFVGFGQSDSFRMQKSPPESTAF